MARRPLLFCFLQFLPLLAIANAGFNTTSDNSIDFDMANIEALISTLRTVENSEIKAFDDSNEKGENNQPFGNLKTDWTRLQLLQEALPKDSVLKDKFKYIFRFLMIAHNEAIQFLHLSESTKTQDTVTKQTSLSLANKNHTDAEKVQKNPVAENMDLSTKDQGVRAKLKNLSTTAPIATPIPILDAKKSSIADSILNANVAISEGGINISTSMHEESTQSAVTSLYPSTSTDKKVISLGQATKLILEMNTSSVFKEYAGSTTERILKEVYKEPSNDAENVSVKTVPNIAITEIQSLNSTASENGSLLTTEKVKGNFSFHPAVKVDLVVDTSITEKYSSPATVSSIVPTKSQSFVSMPGDKLQTPSLQKTENITWTQSTDTLLAENFTAGLVNEKESILSKTQTESTLEAKNYASNTQLGSEIPDSGTSDTAKVFSTENTHIDSPTTEGNKNVEFEVSNERTTAYISNITPTLEDSEIKLPTQKNQNGISTSGKSMPKVPSTIDLIEHVSSVTPKIKENEDNIAIRNHQTEPSIKEKSITNISTKDSIENTSAIPTTYENDRKSEVTSPNNKTENFTIYVEKISGITPTIERNEDNKLASQNNRTEAAINKKSTINVSATKDPTENTSDVSTAIEKYRTSEITSSNNKTENSMDYVERISSVTPTIEKNKGNKLANRNNRTESSNGEKSTANVLTTKASTNNTSDVLIMTGPDKKGEITSLDNKTDKLLHINVTGKERDTTNSIKSIPSVTPKIDKNNNKKVESKKNQTETSIGEISTFNIRESTNPVNKVTTVTSLIDVEQINSKSKNNQKEIVVSEKSISSERRNKDSTEIVQITTPTVKINKEIKSSTQINETEVSNGNKLIYYDNDPPSTSPSTSVLNTSKFFTNTVQLVAGTSVPNASNKTAQNSVSVKPSIQEQGTETSTRNYISDQSTITTNKIEITIPTDSESKSGSEVSTAHLSTEHAINNKNNQEITFKKSKDSTTVTESSEPFFDSETRRINSKPSFQKNPLNAGSSRSNKIFQDVKHRSNDFGLEKNVEFPQIVFYESGTGAKTGNVWRPQLVRQRPAGNNIWKFDSIPNNVGPYGYGYKQPAASPIDSKADTHKDKENPVKFPGQGSRINLLRSRKRGSANSDIEKQFRWFYRHGQADTAHESRDKENDNTKIKIQCKKAHRH